jgi:two-component system, OmpR family, response regulator QseB
MHVLLIEDDLDLGRALQAALKVEGLTSEWLRRAADVPSLLGSHAWDCVLLDLTLPDADGLSLLRAWRKAGVTLPVLIITARGDIPERLAGLDSGADDFVVKPFATAELLSRIRAVLRRAAHQASDVWRVGDLTISMRRREVKIQGELLELSPREFQLLLELAREPGAVVPKGVLALRMDPLGEPVDFATIEVHLSHLRRKIGAQRVRTVRGVGYMLEAIERC